MLKRSVLVVTLLALLTARVPPTQAAGATFTLKVKSAYLRGAPDLTAPRILSIFQDQTYAVTGRTADNAWLRLDPANEAWIMAMYGTVTGDLNSVPVTAAAASQPAPQPGVTPAASQVTSGSATNVRLTITAKSTYLRGAARWDAPRLGSLFKGQVYTVLGRSFDAQWVQIQNGAVSGWVTVGVVRVSLPVLNLPISEGAAPAPAAQPTSARPADPPVVTGPVNGLPVITAHMREIYDTTQTHDNSPYAFAVAGDCNSMSYIYLERIAGGLFDLSPYPNLQQTVGRFYPSFMRASVAVHGGYNSASMFNPMWSDPKQCQAGEGPLACELRVTKASVVFVALGTGDHLVWEGFEANYRKIIELALQDGVLPVLVTKADTLETQQGGAPADYINTVIRRLGAEYDVPVMDFDQATRTVENHGLADEGKYDFHLNVPGMNLHILLTLQTLEAIWKR